MENKIVLVTAVGTMTATTIVRELKKEPGFYVIGTDINPAEQIVTSKDVDEFYIFPSAVDDPQCYLEYVLEFCRIYHVAYYFSVIDEEVANVSKNRSRFEEIGVKVCLANDEAISICHYKNVFSDWIKAEFPEVSIKAYKNLSETQNAKYPLFVKPVEGRASIGCYKVESYEQLRKIVGEQIIGEDVIIQDYIDCGKIVTVDMLRNRSTGQFFQMQRIELMRNANGCGVAVHTIYDTELERIVMELCERLDLDGVVNAEFFAGNDGYKIIEVNPRFSAGAVFTCMAGGDLVRNAIRIANGEMCETGKVETGKSYARRYEAYEM